LWYRWDRKFFEANEASIDPELLLRGMSCGFMPVSQSFGGGIAYLLVYSSLWKFLIQHRSTLTIRGAIVIDSHETRRPEQSRRVAAMSRGRVTPIGDFRLRQFQRCVDLWRGQIRVTRGPLDY